MSIHLTQYDIECLEQATKLISADLSIHYSIEDIAKKVAMGKTKFKASFRLHYGVSVYHYLRQLRMQLAMDLLNHTEKTIKQIARLTGFHHHSNFITAFNNYHGITPGQVRKNKLINKMADCKLFAALSIIFM